MRVVLGALIYTAGEVGGWVFFGHRAMLLNRLWGAIRLEPGPMPRQRPWTASVTVSDVLQGIYAPSASLASAKAL